MLCGNPWAEGGGREGLGHSDLTTADTASLQGEPQAAGMVPAWTATQEPGPRGPGLGDAHSSLPAGLAAIDTHSLNLPAAPWRGEARPAPIPRDGGPDLLSIPRGGGTRPAPIPRSGGPDLLSFLGVGARPAPILPGVGTVALRVPKPHSQDRRQAWGPHQPDPRVDMPKSMPSAK